MGGQQMKTQTLRLKRITPSLSYQVCLSLFLSPCPPASFVCSCCYHRNRCSPLFVGLCKHCQKVIGWLSAFQGEKVCSIFLCFSLAPFSPLSKSTYNYTSYILCSHQLHSSAPFSSHFLISSRLLERKALFPLR